jgi:hypothetical protein
MPLEVNDNNRRGELDNAGSLALLMVSRSVALRVTHLPVLSRLTRQQPRRDSPSLVESQRRAQLRTHVARSGVFRIR